MKGAKELIEQFHFVCTKKLNKNKYTLFYYLLPSPATVGSVRTNGRKETRKKEEGNEKSEGKRYRSTEDLTSYLNLAK